MSDILDDKFVDLPDPKINPSNKFLIISIAALLLGFVFKIQHWPGSGLLLVFGSAFIAGEMISRVIWTKPSGGMKFLFILISILLSAYMFTRNNYVGDIIYLASAVIYFIISGVRFRNKKKRFDNIN